MKKIDYRHYICFSALALSVGLTFACFPFAFGRLLEAFADVFTSFVNYFAAIFEFKTSVAPTVVERSAMPFVMPWNLPNTWEEFQVAWTRYWEIFGSADNVNAFFAHLSDVLIALCKFALIVTPVVFAVILVAMRRSNEVNNDFNKDSKALARFKRFMRKFYDPAKAWFKSFVAFCREKTLWRTLIVVVWLFNFNVFSVFLEAFAFYFYFIASFTLKDVYVQFVKLMFDLSPMLDFVPGVVWGVLLVALIVKIRRKIGFARLNHMENMNKGFLLDRPIVSMSCGTMGKGKTTWITSAAVSWETIFRDKAFELLLETDMKFPFFPWINFENALKQAISRHTVFNLATCRRFVSSKKRKFEKDPRRQNVFMYDFERYGTTFSDGLKVIDVWQALSDYAQLYFIYVVQSSLVLSNYSVRVDNVLEDVGNFPLWDKDLFERRPELAEAYSRHSHILDFDMLRLGKKVVENNRFANSFEFGVVAITEIGKERGNILENKDKKKSDVNANQLNDLFNSELKMIRHAGTVCNFCFVRVLLDEQRPESWGADGKDLADVIFIRDKSEPKLAMPFFHLEDLVLDLIISKFRSRYSKYRFYHGNNTLLMYLYHAIVSRLYNYRARIYNTFGFQTWDLRITDGRDEDEFACKKFYLLFRKDYSDRFASDAYSDFYVAKSLGSDFGLDDLPEYAATKASVSEFKQQNSYFMNDLFGGLFKENNEKKDTLANGTKEKTKEQNNS